MNWHPLRFRPVYKERVWGGRRLASLYRRDLPGTAPIGESWEITDRPEGESVVAEGALAGRTLRELVAADAPGLLGDVAPRDGRFPLLVKILDARDVLSLQVHPPAARARQLGGEPKTEMWFFTAAEPGAEIYAGLRPGVTREAFAEAIRRGEVAGCFHRLPISAGDAMFLPSGRVHALGAGLMLFEIQESSDTTYRVYDWDRRGLDGQPRPLHVAESLESIDFSDVEPALVQEAWRSVGGDDCRTLVDDPLFRVEAWRSRAGQARTSDLRRCRILGVSRGRLRMGGATPVHLQAGDFVLLPAALGRVTLEAEPGAEWLAVEPGADGRRIAGPLS